MRRINLFLSFIIYLFFIFIPSPSHTNWIPEISLEPSGSAYIGKYSSNSERYNVDAGEDILFSLLSWEKIDFFVEYTTNLEMAKQVGNVTLDPRYAHWFIIGGFKLRKGSYLLKSYLVHDCKHIIDFPPDSNKVVFNRLKFSLSKNFSNLEQRFQTGFEKEKRLRKPRWEFIYGFYPQSKVIDYLNSRPYYHHDFALHLEYPLFFFTRAEFFSGIKGTYTISANDPPKYYKDISILIEVSIFRKKGSFGFYIEYFPLSQDPMKSPEGLTISGIRYLF